MRSLIISESEKHNILEMYKSVLNDTQINYNLINEAYIGLEAVGAIDDVIKALSRAQKSERDDFFKILDSSTGKEIVFQGSEATINQLKTKLNAAKNAIKNNTQGLPDMDILKRELGDSFDDFISILRNFKSLAGKPVIDDVYENFLETTAKINKTNQSKAEYDFLRKVYNELVSTRQLREDEFYTVSEIEAALAKVLKNPNTGDVPELFIKTILPKIESKIKSIPEVIKKAAEAESRIASGALSKNLTSVLPGTELDILQQDFPRFWIRYIKELRRLGWGTKKFGEVVDDKATQEIEKKLEDLEQMIAKKIQDGLSYDDEIKKIADLCIFARRQYQTSAYNDLSDFYRKWLSENKIVTYDESVFKEFLAKNPEINFLLTTKSSDISDFSTQVLYQRIATFFNPFRGRFQDVISARIAGKNPDGTEIGKSDILSAFKKATSATAESISLSMQREAMKVVWGSRMLQSEVKILVAKFGVRGYFQQRVKSFIFIHFVLLPAVYSFFDSFVSIMLIRDKLNADLEEIKKYFCNPGKMIFTQEQCDNIKPIPTEDINYLENFWSYFPLVAEISKEESSSYVPITSLDNIIVNCARFLEAFKKSDFTYESFLQTLIGVKIPIPQELKDLGYNSVYDYDTNVKNMLATINGFPKPVSDWMKNNPKWSPIPKMGKEYDQDDIKYIDNTTGQEVPTKTDNTTTMYTEENIVEKGQELIDKWDDNIEKSFIRNKFENCLFENDLGELYDKSFGEEGFEFFKLEDGDIFFKIKRMDGTIDEIYKVSEIESSSTFTPTYRYKDDEVEFTCERAEEVVLNYVKPSSGDEISSVQAKKMDFIKYLKFFENKHPDVKLIYIDDNTISFDMDNKKYITKKYGDGGPWYWVSGEDENGETEYYDKKKYELVDEDKLVYESTPKKIKTLNESIREKLTSKYIDKTKKMKTLNESIREKLTSKYVNKTNKFLKINENYEKVHKYFENGDYDNYFNKMFKLAEAFKNSKLYINESDDELFSKGISLLGGQEEMIKEKFVDFLSKDLGLTKSMKDYIEPQIKNMSNTQIGDLFMKPSVVIDIIVDAVVENVKSSASEPTDLMSAIELTTVPYFDSPEFRYKLSKVLKPMIGQKLENKKGKIVDMVRRALKAKEDKSES